jgi:drug/metabolite transporter (DMT)-like permease
MRAILYLLMATTCWGLNFHLAKVMLATSSAMEAGLWRYIFGVTVLLLVSYRHLPTWRDIRDNAKPLLLIGGIGLFVFNFLFFTGMQYTTAVNASLIVGLNPATTLVLASLILGIRISRRQTLGILLAFVGVIYLVLKGNLSDISQMNISTGDIWIFAANVAFALHHVWVKKYAGKLHNQTFTFLTNAVCLAGFVLVMPFQGIGSIGDYPGLYWLAALGMGGLGTALAYMVWNLGIAKVGAPQAGIFMNFVPMSAALFALMFGESLHLYHLISGLLVVSGMIIMQGIKQQPSHKREQAQTEPLTEQKP